MASKWRPPPSAPSRYRKFQLALYQLVCTIVLKLWGWRSSNFFRSHLELTGVFAGTFMKDKRGTADMRADLQSLCRAKTNKPRTDHLRLATIGPPDDTSD